MSHVTLLGAEDVQRASSTISSAADSMQQTGGYLYETVRRFRAAVEELDIVLARDRQERKKQERGRQVWEERRELRQLWQQTEEG